MRTLILFFIALTISLKSLSQQNKQGYFYYVKDSLINLTIDTKKVFVKFTSTSTPNERLSAVSGIFNIKSSSQNKLLNSSSDHSIIELNDSLDENTTLNGLAALKSNPTIMHATPVLLYKGHDEAVTDKFIVELKDLSQMAKFDSILSTNGDSIYNRVSWNNKMFIVGCTNASTLNSLQQTNLFYSTGIFAFCEPDFLYLNAAQTLYFPNEWGLQNTGQTGTAGVDINAAGAWAITTGDRNIKIADLDEGVDLTHPDLIGNLLPGFDATYAGNGGHDINQTNNSMGGADPGIFHGTGTAGIAAATGANAIVGVAYTCSLIPVRISTDDFNFYPSDIANGIHWAASPTGGNADVLTNSYGGFPQSNMIDAAINYAVTSGRNGLGCVLVFASGNGNPAGVAQNSVAYPASSSQVLSVGACDEWGGIAGAKLANPSYLAYSNYGTGLDVVAPGSSVDPSNLIGGSGGPPAGTIYTTVPPGSLFDDLGGGYTSHFQGTSSACPFAAGVAALVLSVNKCLSYQSVINIIEFTCTKQPSTANPLSYDNSTPFPKNYCYTTGMPNGSWNEYLGYGRINAGAAVTVAYTAEEPFTINTVQEQNVGSRGAKITMELINQKTDCYYAGLAVGTYYFYPYMVTANITYPYTINPVLAPTSLSNGWSADNPNSGAYFCGITNVTSTSATLYSYSYDVYDLQGNEIGYYPGVPAGISFSYSIISAMPANTYYFQDQNVNYANNYSATSDIFAGYDVTNAVSFGDYIIQYGADIGFHSETNIDLKPGFDAVKGSMFDAAIGPAFYPCINYPNPQRKISSNDSSRNNIIIGETADTIVGTIMNYPNPFKDYTYLRFTLDTDENNAIIGISDLLGREIHTFSNNLKKGINRVKIDGESLTSGCYIYTITTTHERIIGKMLKIE